MQVVTDRKPLPPRSLFEAVEALEIGESLLVKEGKLTTLRPVVSRVRQRNRERQFRTAMADDGPRVWRTA